MTSASNSMMTTQFAHETTLTLRRLLPRLEQEFADQVATAEWATFRHRLDQHFPRLFDLLRKLYQGRYDFFYHLERILALAAQSWLDRPAALKALDDQREAQPDWYQAQQMLGGVCYVDLFAGDLNGICQQIPYFKELARG